MEREDLKEFGKHLLNIGVAIIVFSIIQPLTKGEFNPYVVIFSILAYIIVVMVGMFFIRKGGKKDVND